MSVTTSHRFLIALTLVSVGACGDDPKPDQAAPEITIEAPAAGTRVAEPVVVSGVVRDARIKGRKTSGVAAVTVDGVAATLEGERFTATLTGLSPGLHTFVVAATDKAGNAAQATVDVDVGPPVTQLLVEPPIVSLNSVQDAVQLVTTGFFKGSGSSDLTLGLSYESANPAVAVVSASGVVTAASQDAVGTVEITVHYGELAATVTANVRIDSDAPSRPRVMGYFAQTNQRDQTWTGLSEPDALVSVTGTRSPTRSPTPIDVTADKSGRFWLNVPLAPNALNAISVTVTDVNGNAATYPFPVTQSDGMVDAGTLHFSSSRQMVGFVGELVPEPLIARAYMPSGAPLAGASVTFEVVTGSGTLSADGSSAVGAEGVSEAGPKLVVRTNGAGYARARWTLGASDFDRVEVHAALQGDVGFPVVFMAEGFMHLEQPTAVEGIVYDENRIPVVGLPVTVLAPGSEYASATTGAGGTTDDRGRFRIFYAPQLAEPTSPLGQHIRLDGTAMNGDKHVRIDRLVTVLPGQINDVGTFWIPRLPEGVAPKLDANGVVTEAITLERELIPGNGPVRVQVPVGTKITWPGGVPEDARKLTLLAIPEIRAPMSLPDGFFSREVLALQPGGTRFEPPLPLDLPNSGAEPPGAALTMWSYDHFQSKFIPIGRGIVSADGTRVVSEAGSGIRVGAWHMVSPPVPDPPCTATGQTKTTVIKGTPPHKGSKQDCKCYLEGTDQPTDCPEDKDRDGTPDKFIVTNIRGCKPPPPPPAPEPNKPPPPKPPVKKIEVVCEEKPLQITQPTEIISYVKLGDTIAFKAECLDNHKSDGDIVWQRSAPDPKAGNGPRFTLAFEKEGRYVISASAATKTCKGNDQRTVVVKACVDVGVARVCGDKIEPVGPTADERFLVSGNVRMGMKGSGSEPGSSTPNSGDLYLMVGGDMVVDAAVARPSKATTVRMEIGYPIVGPKITPIIYLSEFTLDATGLVTLAPFADGTAEGVPFRLLQFALQFSEFQMLKDGIFLKNPYLGLFGRNETFVTSSCPKPKVPDALDPVYIDEYHPPKCKPEEFVDKKTVKAKDLQIVIDGVVLTRDSITPRGVFEYKPTNAAGEPGLQLGSPFLQLNSIKVGLDKDRFIGELALQMNLKRFDLGIKTTVSIGEGFFAGTLGVTFGGFNLGGFEVPGIPIIPAFFAAPVYLSSLGLEYESSSWPVSDTATVKLTGKAGITLGPTLTLLSKKVALATGDDLTLSLVPYPLSFSLRGELSLLSASATGIDDATTKTSIKAVGSYDIAFEPSFSAKIAVEISMYVPDLFGLEVTDPFYTGTVAGGVSVVPEDGSVLGFLMGSVNYQIPKTKFTPRVSVLAGEIKAAYASSKNILTVLGSLSFSCISYTCTLSAAHDPVNGLSVWLQTNKGDFVQLYGLNPNNRVAVSSAPSLGVSSETAASVAYDGNPLNFELLEPASRLIITLEKATGPVVGELTLPNGDRVPPSSNPEAFANELGVDFDEGLDGVTASWTVYDAEPGTYTYAGPNDGLVIHRVYAFIPAPLPILHFDEPFLPNEAGDDMTITWTGSGGSSDATVTLLAVPVNAATGGALGWVELGTLPLVGSGFDIDEGLLPYGDYRIVAQLLSQGSTTFVQSIGTYTLGIPAEADPNAPRYVRVGAVVPDVAAGKSLMTVQWYPSDALVATRHVVTLFDDLGEVVLTQAVKAPGNHVVLALTPGSRTELFGGGKVMVEAQADLERAPATVAVPLNPLGFFAVPASRARVGQAWTYLASTSSSRARPVVIVQGPPGAVVAASGELSWTPIEADVGVHPFKVRFGEQPYQQERSFEVQVLPGGEGSAGIAAPEPVMGPEARVVAGVVGTPVEFTAEFQALDPVTLSLVSAPLGATLSASGEVRWTASSSEAIEARGNVPFVVRATAAGLSNDVKWVVHFVDRDGDGLSDAWELASGTNPELADSMTADPDGDGLSQASEQRLDTLGDVADSDGDGLADGAEATLSVPPAGFTFTSDPRLADADLDGVGDAAEISAGTNPASGDSDGDGVSDQVEKDNGTDPMVKADGDADGVFDDRERVVGTDLTLADTDGDGLNDGEEVFGLFQGATRCWPPTNALVADSDGDDVDDATEARRCDGVTNPNNPGIDADGDGLRSDRERVLGTLDSRADSDGDGVLDPIEVVIGTDPASADSKPEGVETEADQLIANSGESIGLILAPESLTDFGIIDVFPDADHDSANDEYETAWEYDPASPFDAYDDADGDLVPMWQESRIGTNPRAKDTDGDGVDDGVELQDGTDPNDATSVSSSGPVVAITSYPRKADLQAHAFIGMARLALEVEGTRGDGSVVDLTATLRGTSYVVTPPEAGTIDASGGFTATPGFVGDATITVTNLGLTATTAMFVTSFVPGPVASLPLGGSPTAIALGEDLVFIGGDWGLRVVDVSVIETPVALGDVALGAAPVALAADGSWLAVGLGAIGLAVVDVSQPDQAVVVARVAPEGTVNGVAWADGFVIAATSKGLVRVDPTAGLGLVDGNGDGEDDRIVDVQAVSSAFSDVAKDLDRIAAARSDGHIVTYRLVSGGLVQELDLVAGANATRIALQGGVLAGATGDSGSRLVLGGGATWTRSAALGIVGYTCIAPDFVLATESGSGTVVFLDARGAAPMTTLGSVDFDAFFQGGLVADERYFFLADAYNQKLQIGAHGALNDTLGIPPVVVPVTPRVGSTIEEGTRIAVEVAAHDDIAIKVVTLTRDGEDVVSWRLPPYTMNVKTTNVSAATTMEIGAYATDYGGNIGEMAPLKFTVTPVADTTAPTVVLLEPASEEWVEAGSKVLVAVAPTDEHAIWKVEIRLDGALVASLEDAPYTTDVTIPASAPAGSNGRLALTVTAFDYGENSASAQASLVFGGIDLIARGVTAIAADDTTYDGEDILVRRGTLAIDGAHTFGKVRVGRGGILTHSDASSTSDAVGLDLQCERVDVAPTGAIDVSGRGYLGDCAGGSCGVGPYEIGNVTVARAGQAGGSHGGVGGGGSNGTWGDWRTPVTLGGGGNYGAPGGEAGGDGGGRIAIVTGEFVLDGVMRANGGNGAEVLQKSGSGGAGGSILVTATSLAGIGRIEANGGAAASNRTSPGSPGGGGRIALTLDDVVDFDLTFVRAWPGPTAVAAKGGSGTVFLDIGGDESLVLDDGRRSAGVDNRPFGFTATDTPIVLPPLVVRGSSRLVLVSPLETPLLQLEQEARVSPLETTHEFEAGLVIDADRIEIGPDAAIDVTGRGYLGDCRPGTSCGAGPRGPGNVAVGHLPNTGGAHGGSSGGGAGPATYGSWTSPVDLGMGGNYGAGGGEPGGDGGGRMRIRCDALVLDGALRADGEPAAELIQSNGSGGAGGSIWLTTTTLTGSGQISADGGRPASNPVNPGGPGAGGRIAITAQSMGLSAGAVHAYPGESLGGGEAGAGTVWSTIGNAPAQLVIDDDGRSAGIDDRPLGQVASETPVRIEDLVVRGRTRLVLTAPLEASIVRLEEDAVLTHLETSSTFEAGLELTADRLEIDAGAAIDVSQRGYEGDCAPGAVGCGTGAHTLGNVNGGASPFSGGSHGGLGGGASPNPTYGDSLAPTTLGAGGGYGAGGGEPGGDGGGRLRLFIDALVVDGVIRADGGDGLAMNQRNGSGGAGGSIWISANTLSGSGHISADGGAPPEGGANPGANGGGGRIAIEYASHTFDFADVTAWPGAGPGAKAAAGTVYLTADGGVGSLVLDDGGLGDGDGRALAFDASDTALSLDVVLVLRGTTRLALGRPLVVKQLVLEDGAVLTHLQTTSSYEGSLIITADTVRIGQNAAIDVSARGYEGDCRPGAVSCGGGPHTVGNVNAGHLALAGGSHAGLGGGVVAHRPFGDPWTPVTLGGGGGYGSGGGEPGGDGGGRVRIVAQRVELAGAIRADGGAGQEGGQSNGSGGAGGSVFITTGVIAGAGTISARGGDAASAATNPGSGGGGGRVALVYTTLDGFDPERTAVLGGSAPGALAIGGPGTLRLDPATGRDRLIVDNGDRVNLNETAPWLEVGLFVVSTVEADGVTVVDSPWVPESLVGLPVTVGTRSFVVAGNTANKLDLTGSLAGVAVGDVIRGSRDAKGELELRGGARVSFVDELRASVLVVGDAVLTHPATPAVGPERGLSLIITNAATISASGAIDVSARGYPGDCGDGDNSCGGGAHSLGSSTAAFQLSGGSHGGLGGGTSPGFVFGEPLRPVTLGGGGGFGNGGGDPGGRGGGRVKLVAGTLIVAGGILARGGPGQRVAAENGGGGAGGSIWLTTQDLGGSGAIDASGGDAGPDDRSGGGAGGGGGRVALYWEGDVAGNAFDPDTIDAHGGSALTRFGGPGTVFIADPVGVARLVVDNAGVVNPNEVAPWVEVGLRTVTSAASDRVTVTNAGWIPDALIGSEVVFGMAATRYNVISNTSDTLVFQASDGNVAGVTGSALRGYHLFDGQVEIHGAAQVALVDRLGALALLIDGGGVLTHPATFGAQPEHGLWVELSGALTIAADGRIDVSGRGYRGDCTAGDGGCADGGTWFGNVGGGAGQYSGGSFGGLGGGPLPNPVYGDSLATWLLGAGGGYGNGGGEAGGSGGGRVRLIVGSIALGGQVIANGHAGASTYAGGGAGGGIFVSASQITGGGQFNARGGDGNDALGSGGGGGRVHIEAPGAAGSPDVRGGSAVDASRAGAAGTSVRD